MNKTAYTLLVGSLALTMASCSLWEKATYVVKGDAGEEKTASAVEENKKSDKTPTKTITWQPVAQHTEKAETPTATKTKTQTPSQSTTSATTAQPAAPKVNPTASAIESEVQNALNNQPAQPAANTSVLAKKIDGEWVIIEAGKYKISQDEDMPYLNFESTKGNFYSSNGCNILNGKFEVRGENVIAFSNVLSTMMACPHIKYEAAINSVIMDGSSVMAFFENKGSESYLTFKSSSGTKLMVLRRNNMEKLNGQWVAEEIGDVNVKEANMDIFIDVAELTVHGNTGCNFFNGDIIIDPAKENSIQFQSMAVTMRLCPNSDYERIFLIALEETDSYELDGSSTLWFNDSKGHKVMKLTRSK